MKIQKLQLENFRGFKGKHKIEFKPDVNIFVGLNGAGKTTVLDAISIFLRQFIKDLTTDINADFIDSDNIFNIDSIITQLSLITDAPDLFRKHEITYKRNNISVYKIDEVNYDTHKIVRALLQEQPLKDIPIFTYYNSNRILYDYAIETKPSKMFEAYKEAFGINFRNFKSFFHWYINEENIENDIRLNQDSSYRNVKLEVVRKAISNFSNFLKGLEYREYRVKRNIADIPRLLLKKDSDNLYFEMLSNGEQAIFYYVADIARRLAITNPDNINANNDGKGIVLIDEVDSHLHPSWQRKIIPALTKTFPNIQFFITTHSPQVLSNVKHENIIVIEDFKIKKNIAHTLGRDTNSILYNIFNEEKRPEEYKQKINSIYELIDNDNIAEAKKELDILKQDMGEDDVEINRIQMQIDLME